MMAALIAGGMDAAYSEKRNALANQHADELYHPNRSGLYEVPLSEYDAPGFPLQYDGKLIKVMSWGMRSLAVHDYRVVLMRRHPEEIRQSYEGFFGRSIKLDDYDPKMDALEKQLCNRRDVLSVTVIQYRDLVEHPHRELTRLHNWPIDHDLAAATIDPEQYRFRLERLTVGI